MTLLRHAAREHCRCRHAVTRVHWSRDGSVPWVPRWHGLEVVDHCPSIDGSLSPRVVRPWEHPSARVTVRMGCSWDGPACDQRSRSGAATRRFRPKDLRYSPLLKVCPNRGGTNRYRKGTANNKISLSLSVYSFVQREREYR
jgi:hypothetical protein